VNLVGFGPYRPRAPFEDPMLDIVMLAIGLGFFAVGCLYLYACDRL
jgi:hypothetical protein